MKIQIHDYAGHPFQGQLSRELAKRGHEVTHAYFGGDPGPKGSLHRRDDDPLGLSFERVDLDVVYNKGAFFKRRFNDIKYGTKIAALIDRIKPEIVVSGNTPVESQERIVKASHKAGANFVFWLQDIFSIAALKILPTKFGLIGTMVGKYYVFKERRQFHAADAIITITDGFAEQLKTERWGIPASKMVTIENWGALSEISPQPKVNPWSIEFGLADKFVFLYTGTLGLKHDPRLLVEIARRMRDVPAVRVVAVAQGLNVAELQRLKDDEGLDNIQLLPLQPFDILPQVLGSGDVLVSVIEEDAGQFSVPSKVQSYLCAGRPILLSAPTLNLAATVLVREHAGVVVSPGQLEAFADAAAALQSDEVIRRGMGERGRAYAERAYDISAITDRFEAVFQQALQ
jgi:glycosyltransferase involved in cell wall biosynthesis